MARFCGRCGAGTAGPQQTFCNYCGSQLAPQQPGLESDAARTDERSFARPWELAALCLIMVIWAAAAVVWVVPLATSLARGEAIDIGRAFETLVVVLLPPIGLACFIAARLHGRGGWRWAAPLLIAVPIVVLVVPKSATSPLAPVAALARPPAPTATPSPVPTPTPAGLFPGLPPIAVPSLPPLPLPSFPPLPVPNLPAIGPTPIPATPVPGTRLTAEEARVQLKQSLGECIILHTEIDRAEVTFQQPDWQITLPLSRATWKVNDATGEVTADPLATLRQRECRPAKP